MKRFSPLTKQSDNALSNPFSSSTTDSSTPDDTASPNSIISRRRSRHFTVAIVTRAFTPGMQETINGITRRLNEQAPGQFTCTLFDGRGDERRLFNYTTQIIQNYTMPYDVIVTIGAQASQIATRVSLLLSIQIPIIFAGVESPAHLGIVYPGKRADNNITGIAIDGLNHKDSLATLLSLKDGVKRVLLPYNPKGAWLAHHAAEFTRLLCAQDIELYALPVSSPEDVRTKIMPFMHDVDTIMTMRDDVVVNSMDNIINTCNNYGVTLYSADLESVEQGAALGFAIRDVESGTEIAQYILHLFKDHAAPHELPIKTLSTRWFVGINEQTATKQGVDLSKKSLKSVGEAIIFRGKEDNDANEKNE